MLQMAVKALDSVGLCDCVPDRARPRVLRVTLLRATDIQHRARFYFEAWGKPRAGYPKNSRVHVPVTGTVDLGGENIDLDWFGNETHVVIHAVEYTGAKQSVDVSLAELQVPGAEVARLAKEGRDSAGDLRYGARAFEMAAVPEKTAVERRERFQSMLIPEYICLRLMASQGTMMQSRKSWDRDDEEKHQLREENTRLRSHARAVNVELPPSTRQRRSGCCRCGGGSDDDDDDELTEPRARRSPMCLVVRFEFLDRARGAEVDEEQIRRFSP